jgi:hypothetical protein
MAEKPREGVYVSVGEIEGGWWLRFEYTDGTSAKMVGPFDSHEEAMAIADDFAKQCLDSNPTAELHRVGKSDSRRIN